MKKFTWSKQLTVLVVVFILSLGYGYKILLPLYGDNILLRTKLLQEEQRYLRLEDFRVKHTGFKEEYAARLRRQEELTQKLPVKISSVEMGKIVYAAASKQGVVLEELKLPLLELDKTAAGSKQQQKTVALLKNKNLPGFKSFAGKAAVKGDYAGLVKFMAELAQQGIYLEQLHLQNGKIPGEIVLAANISVYLLENL